VSKVLPLLIVLAACSSPEAGDDAEDLYGDLDNIDELDALDGKADGTSDWTVIGTGVIYQQVNTGHAIVIAYGGYTARLTDSAAWSTELVDQRLGAAGVGHIFAVRGPADASYSAREIANTKLRAHLATFYDGTSPIYVVAHSSGSYVAHELFGQLQSKTPALLPHVAYADLDGGGSGLTTSIIGALGKAEFVYARDPTLASGYSMNSGTAKALAMAYKPKATLFEVNVPSTGCKSGAGWCLHDVVITHKPHNPQAFDLAHDYTDFVNRPVTVEYLDPIL
jgi:hypothetical protein